MLGPYCAELHAAHGYNAKDDSDMDLPSKILRSRRMGPLVALEKIDGRVLPATITIGLSS